MTPKERMPVVAFRLPASLVRRLDAHARQLRLEQPGVEFTRADALRLLVTRALDAEEARHGKG